MADKTTAEPEPVVETEPVERDRYTEPRERNDPDHRDAGQQHVDEHEADRSDA